MLTNGMFYSKLIYCLPLYGNVFDIESLSDNETRQNSFTKANLNSLQVLQNKILRMSTNSSYDTPVAQLLQKSGSLSINQLIGYTTVLAFYKIRQTKEPAYLAKRMGLFENLNNSRSSRTRFNKSKITFNMARAREGFLYRGESLWLLLPDDLKQETQLSRFKTKLREWIKLKIKPLPR